MAAHKAGYAPAGTDEADVHVIHGLAVAVGLAAREYRPLLIPDPARRATIPRLPSERAQLLADLQALAGASDPSNGQPLLIGWLRAAADVLGPRPEALRLRHIADRLARLDGDAPRLRRLRPVPPEIPMGR